MVWEYTIRWTDVAIIFAALLGPVLAVQAQKWLERRREIKERRLAIFRTLMATRAAMLSAEHVVALNAIPVEFYGPKGKLKDINDAWKLFLDHHGHEGPSFEVWVQKRLDLFLDLLFLVSRYLGYRFSRAQLERDIYSPRLHGDIESEQTIIRKGLAKLFNGETVLPMALKEIPASEESLKNQTAIQELLLEWLEGQRAVRVTNDKPEAGAAD